MREDNLLCPRKKCFVATTDSDHGIPVYPNLAAEIDITAPDQLWVSDLTYIRLGQEFIYLAVVLDACSRRYLSRSLGRRLDTALAATALKMVLTERKPQVHHSDRGIQYASGEYTRLLKQTGVAISMPQIKPQPQRKPLRQRQSRKLYENLEVRTGTLERARQSCRCQSTDRPLSERRL